MKDSMPCYVTFSQSPVEDRNESIKAGHTVYKTIDMAIITPPGRGDNVERVAEEWLKQKLEANDPFYSHYSNSYKAWKEGQEMPTVGTSVKLWPAANPAEVKQLLDSNIRTVEDLASASQQSLQRVGMGAMALQKRAQTWLASANDVGKSAERINALEQKIKDLTEQLADALANRPPKKKPGRPRKVDIQPEPAMN